MIDACPDSSVLQELLDGAIGRDDEAVVESHVAACVRCQRRLDVLTQYPALALAGPRDIAWTESHSGAVIERVAAALATEAGPFPANVDRAFTHRSDRLPEIPGYEILDRIGTGGSSDVYRAFHQKLRRAVALKVIRDRALPEQRDRFRREAEALARLRHEGIVQIFETGEADGLIFMSLEYEAGGSLSQFLKGVPQPAPEAARFVASAAVATHAAHQEGLIHRDLKPGNLLMHPAPANPGDKGLGAFTPKLTDFGLVKQIADTSALTATKDVLGTPSYMAPEQVSAGDQPIGPATDVYALGAVLYECLTGRPPFRAATAIDTVVQVRFDDPVPPSRLLRSVPRDLETICLKCLEKEPSRRYGTAKELADDLTRFVRGRPVKARTNHAWIRAWRWTRRNPRTAFLSATVFTLLATFAILGPLAAYREAELRKKSEAAEAKALAQWDRADRNLLAANDATWQATMMKVAELDRSGEPGGNELQMRIIEHAMPILDKAKARDPDLPGHRMRWGTAMYYHGRAARRSGDGDRAEADLREAANIVGRLAEDHPGTQEYAVLAALVQLELAHLAVTRSPQDAEERMRNMIPVFERITVAFPSSWDGWYGLSESYQLLADFIEAQPAKKDEFIALLNRLAEALHKVDSLKLDRGNVQEAEAQTRMRIALSLQKLRQYPESEAELRRALAVALRTPRGGTPSHGLVQLRLQSSQMLAERLADALRFPEALPHAASASRLAWALVELHPSKEERKALAVQCDTTLAKCLIETGQSREARIVLERAEALAGSARNVTPEQRDALARLRKQISSSSD